MNGAPLSTDQWAFVAASHPCEKCGNEKEWRECYNCDGGYSYHDCGDDCCCCLDPEYNVTCDICDGREGWLQCFHCHPWED